MEKDSGDSLITLQMYLISWDYTLENGLNGNFYVMPIFLQLKKIATKTSEEKCFKKETSQVLLLLKVLAR